MGSISHLIQIAYIAPYSDKE